MNKNHRFSMMTDNHHSPGVFIQNFLEMSASNLYKKHHFIFFGDE